MVLNLLGFGLIMMLTQFPGCDSLDNGLALTPPMGWLSWTRFLCQTDCRKFPSDCISEHLFVQMADIMVKEGYRDAGYVHVNIDDCWMGRSRDANKRLVSDPDRFPQGIKWLADYMHERGLKLGIYQNYGKHTCMGFPGSQEYMQIDADTFAQWDVDMVKFDGCFNDPLTLDTAFPEMGRYLNMTGRSIVYSCSWPFYIRKELRKEPNYREITKHCNLWRNFDDIQINWKSIEHIIEFYDKNQKHLGQFHGPGHWNDPDMIVVGNPGLTTNQCRAQMALWAIWSAPLLMSNDLRNMRPEFKEILLNRRVIAVNQDPLGKMGEKIKEMMNGKISVYLKPLSTEPLDVIGRSYAIVFLNLDEYRSITVEVSLKLISLPFDGLYEVEDLFIVNDKGSATVNLAWNEIVEVKVPPTGVVMWRVSISHGTNNEDANVGLWPIYFEHIFGTFWWFYAVAALILIILCVKRLRFIRLKRMTRCFV